ncbi:translation elongation factor Ts [Candidatus Methylacidithermus pantelleriae]|uniref:Elongation factor Ts n=1 Tax=Candidatus Methylacidithermus pantelleriae TaxID=2744239 RepID=A0A8J2BKB1_9BACT|nr:translation elongation factor Ts [Candidatus Methylacidithermus pantelleriae]CAF0689490.1 Elongation factor Ts [Candidatus Methylacidithermus pantelleriae]
MKEKIQISTELVRALREKTGAGIMDCKRALEACGGDLEEAQKWLFRQGAAVAERKAGRQAKEGVIASYVHVGDRIGVLVEVNCETDFVARTPQFRELVKDLTLQIAAAAPLYVSRNDVPPAEIRAQEQAIAQEHSGKPPAVVERIVAGKLEKYYATVCLLEQPFVKDQNITVAELIASKIQELGENIVVRRFVRYQLGETA